MEGCTEIAYAEILQMLFLGNNNHSTEGFGCLSAPWADLTEPRTVLYFLEGLVGFGEIAVQRFSDGVLIAKEIFNHIREIFLEGGRVWINMVGIQTFLKFP